jgi:hypothetical protein
MSRRPHSRALNVGSQRFNRAIVWTAVCALVLSSLMAGLGRAGAASGDGQTFLPLVGRDTLPPAKTVFGLEMEGLGAKSGFQQMVYAGTSWMRFSWNGVDWSSVEANEGVYNWDALQSLETNLKVAASNHIQVILVVRGTPAWAQKSSGYACSAILPEKLPAFARFMNALVARYSTPPFQVKYWEIYNEPDIPPELVLPNSVWGCWGDEQATYFGGEDFGQMLQAVYPQVKAADPQAQVIVGGLVLDCNPDNPPLGKDCRSSSFLEGILRNGGGENFDGVAFHAYDYYLGSLGQFYNPNWASSWDTTGGIANAKAAYIRRLLASFNISGKFILNTENALLCDVCSNDPVFETTKAYYLAQSNADAIAHGLLANIWYKAQDWRGSGLFNEDLSPRPAYFAYSFARRELGAALPLGEIRNYPGVMGYAFSANQRLVWLLWSLDGEMHPLELPELPLAAYDALGNRELPARSVSIDVSPRYYEFSP